MYLRKRDREIREIVRALHHHADKIDGIEQVNEFEDVELSEADFNSQEEWEEYELGSSTDDEDMYRWNQDHS